MSRRMLFFRLLMKAGWVRKDRMATAIASVAVVATIATTSLTVFSDLESKLSREFRSFGANIVVTLPAGLPGPNTSDFVHQASADHNEVVPVGYAIAKGPNDSKVVIGGTDLSAMQKLNSWWSVRSANTAGNALVGARVAETFSGAGQTFSLTYGGKSIAIVPRDIFQSGSEDDSRIYLGQAEFTQLTGIAPNTLLVRAEGTPRQVESEINKLKQAFPGAEVSPVRQVTAAQAAVVGKTRSVVLAASAIVVVLIMLCMVATFTSSVLERRKDFAVMKALGASNAKVNLIFAAEAALLATVGATVGYLLGSGTAFWIGKANFNAAILPHIELAPVVLLGSIALALLASTAPLRLLQQVQPASILRGE